MLESWLCQALAHVEGHSQNTKSSNGREASCLGCLSLTYAIVALNALLQVGETYCNRTSMSHEVHEGVDCIFMPKCLHQSLFVRLTELDAAAWHACARE